MKCAYTSVFNWPQHIHSLTTCFPRVSGPIPPRFRVWAFKRPPGVSTRRQSWGRQPQRWGKKARTWSGLLPLVYVMVRVVRLGEFSPIARLFSLGRFFKNYKSSSNSWATFAHETSYVLILTKKRVGLHFRRLFHKLIWSPWLWSQCFALHVQLKNIGDFFFK
jgi:hypothetical protein